MYDMEHCMWEYTFGLLGTCMYTYSCKIVKRGIFSVHADLSMIYTEFCNSNAKGIGKSKNTETLVDFIYGSQLVHSRYNSSARLQLATSEQTCRFHCCVQF